MIDEPSDPHLRCLSDRLTALNSRRIGLGALGFWALAILILVLHVAGWFGGISDALYFAVVETWLLGLGCVGTPIFALRVLGRHLTDTACLLVSTLMAGGALVYTMFLPSEHPAPLTATFVLVPLLAGAIHGFNASDALKREQAAERRGSARAGQLLELEIRHLQAEKDSLEDQVAALTDQLAVATAHAATSYDKGVKVGIALCGAEIRDRAANLPDLDQMPLAEVRRLRVRAEQALAGEPAAQPLHLVPSQELDRANGHRTDGIGG